MSDQTDLIYRAVREVQVSLSICIDEIAPEDETAHSRWWEWLENQVTRKYERSYGEAGLKELTVTSPCHRDVFRTGPKCEGLVHYRGTYFLHEGKDAYRMQFVTSIAEPTEHLCSGLAEVLATELKEEFEKGERLQ